MLRILFEKYFAFSWVETSRGLKGNLVVGEGLVLMDQHSHVRNQNRTSMDHDARKDGYTIDGRRIARNRAMIRGYLVVPGLCFVILSTA